jgi:hypothetical protein
VDSQSVINQESVVMIVVRKGDMLSSLKGVTAGIALA